MAPEIIQRFEDAVKRYSETRAPAKPKPAPRGGVREFPPVHFRGPELIRKPCNPQFLEIFSSKTGLHGKVARTEAKSGGGETNILHQTPMIATTGNVDLGISQCALLKGEKVGLWKRVSVSA